MRGADRFETSLELFVAALNRPIVYLRLGIPLDDVERFHAVTRKVTVFESGHMELGERGYGPPRSSDEAVFAVNFATTAVLRIEEWERRRRR